MLPIVKAENFKESLRHCHSPADSKELLWKLKVRWYPGTEEGHLVKTKKNWIKLRTLANNVSVLISLRKAPD